MISGAELLALVDTEGDFHDGAYPVGWVSYWVVFEDGAPMLYVQFEADDGQLNSGKWMLIKQEDNRG